MTDRANTITHDRGLATAYERHCFGSVLETWAQTYGATTMLEGPIDGIDGVPGVHGVGLARRGIRVISAVRTEEQAAIARAIYGASGAGANVDVRVASDPMRVADLPACELLVAYDAIDLAEDWRDYVQALAGRATTLLVVTTRNPRHWGLEAMDRVRGIVGRRRPPVELQGPRDPVLPVLWKLGRVREHAFYDCRWLPGAKVDRAIGTTGARLRSKLPWTRPQFVYGAECWPYFGGPGWTDELGPAIRRRRAVDDMPRWLTTGLARMHAFAVDLRARTPQARKRLGRVG